MTVSKDLLLSILSMDAYNRGYNPGISGLNDTSNGSVKVGNATVSFNLQDAGTVFSAAAQAASFYAISYTIDEAVAGIAPDTGIAPGTTVISYRGTDEPKKGSLSSISRFLTAGHLLSSRSLSRGVGETHTHPPFPKTRSAPVTTPAQKDRPK